MDAHFAEIGFKYRQLGFQNSAAFQFVHSQVALVVEILNLTLTVDQNAGQAVVSFGSISDLQLNFTDPVQDPQLANWALPLLASRHPAQSANTLRKSLNSMRILYRTNTATS